MVLVCIIFLVFECCKIECGEAKVGDMVGMVGESYGWHIGLNSNMYVTHAMMVACLGMVIMARLCHFIGAL
jgi:hypothetical protein